MKIIDGFIFYNELDLLEGRLEYLYDTVDFFMLVESNITFSGKNKPYYFRENINRYKKYLDKVIYHPFVIKDLDRFDFTYKPTHMDPNSASWKIEHLHRQELVDHAEIFDDDDMLILSDLDEIPSISAIGTSKKLLETSQMKIMALIQDLYLYNFTNKVVEGWPGSIVSNNRFARHVGGEQIRKQRYNLHRIYDGGYHFSNWMNVEQIKTKLESFSHQEYNTMYYKDLDRIVDRVKKGSDIVDRNIPMVYNDISTIDNLVYSIFSKYQILL